MTNLTNSFGTLYHPQKAFVIYEQQGTAKHIYVESYDIDPQGGDSDERDHHIPAQADHLFRGKLTRAFRGKLTTPNT